MLYSPAVSSEFPISRNHAVAGNDQRIRILVEYLADGAIRLGLTCFLRDPRIGTHLAQRNAQNYLVNFFCERADWPHLPMIFFLRNRW